MFFTDKTWSTIGKILAGIAVLITIFVGIFAILDRFTSDYEMKAYGEFVQIHIPDKFI